MFPDQKLKTEMADTTKKTATVATPQEESYLQQISNWISNVVNTIIWMLTELLYIVLGVLCLVALCMIESKFELCKKLKEAAEK